jgi:SAM-dependent methyltransferase
MVDVSASFSGSIPEYYDSCLGPAWFDAFAVDLAQRLPAKPPGDVLEIACGTGLVTRRLRERLDPTVRLVATDLSKAMLDYARVKLSDSKGIEWREADAVSLPFGDREFGAVVCAFGVMFVPDKKAAFREACRVLKEGGIFLFNVWDRIEENPHIAATAGVVEGLFPDDEEMRFRIPYEMYDPALLQRLLAEAHFGDVKIEKKRLQLDRVSARTMAIGQIRGTPRSLLIEKRGVPLDEVVEKVTAALTQIGGADLYRGSAQAVVAEARRRPQG